MGLSHGIITSILILLAIFLLILAILILIQYLRYGEFNLLLPRLGLVVAGNFIAIILLILSIVLIIIAGVFRPQPEQTNSAQYTQFAYPHDIYNGCGNGTLHLSLQKKSDKFSKKTDRHLRIWINETDINAIQNMIISGKMDFENSNQTEFQKTIEHGDKLYEKFAAEYPYLGRIRDMDKDYVFTLEELPKLREECLKLKLQNPDVAADLALRKFLHACDQAITGNFYLIFYCD